MPRRRMGKITMTTVKTTTTAGTPTTTRYQDRSSGSVLRRLDAKADSGKEISGDDMQRAIVDGTKDLDNQAAGKEYADFQAFTNRNWEQMSPNAREKFRVYEKHAEAAKADGKTGIPTPQWNAMVKEMKGAGYKDETSGRAIEGLRDKIDANPDAKISGDEMQRAIVSGTQDKDNRAASSEYQDFKRFTSEHGDRLSPEAKAKYDVYDKYAKAAQAKGLKGIPNDQYAKMVDEMKVAGYQDKGAGKAIEDLKARNPSGEITGPQMEKTIIDGTKDLDNQAAGKEYADLKKFADSNWSRMSPDAREKFRTYEGYAKAAQDKGETGIKTAYYDKMRADLKKAGYQDASAGKAIEGLKDKKGEISGQDMQRAIEGATKDLDNQAAGKEYADLSRFAKDNWGRMSPDAREKFRVYDKYASEAKAAGKTGIDTPTYDKMVAEMKTAGYQDAGAGRAIEPLKDKLAADPKAQVSGADMEKAIIDGTKDLDNQAAGKEYADLQKFATDNWDRMSPEARDKYQTYERYARKAKADGKTGIDKADWAKMVDEMKGTGYEDASSGAAIQKLKDKDGPISGADMERAIVDGTKDFDDKAASSEYRDFKKFADQNWDRMTPDAREKFRIYEAYAEDAQSRGLSGIPNNEYNAMKKEMAGAGYKDASAGQAIERLKDKSGPITASDMRRAIIDGTQDKDGAAASGEYADFKQFAAENWERMTPGARDQFRTYQQYAESAAARGQTGIPNDEWNRMVNEMKTGGYQDASAGREIDKLKEHTGRIDSRRLIRALDRGTADLDGQAGGKEFADFYRFAYQNWDRLTPDAQAAFSAYTHHVMQAWMTGSQQNMNWGSVMNDMNAAAAATMMRASFFRI